MKILVIRNIQGTWSSLNWNSLGYLLAFLLILESLHFFHWKITVGNKSRFPILATCHIDSKSVRLLRSFIFELKKKSYENFRVFHLKFIQISHVFNLFSIENIKIIFLRAKVNHFWFVNNLFALSMLAFFSVLN